MADATVAADARLLVVEHRAQQAASLSVIAQV